MFKIDSKRTMSMIENDTIAFDVEFNNYTIVETDQIIFTIKQTINDKQPVKQFNATISNNVATFHIDNIGLPHGSYVYDIVAILNNGIKDTVVLPSKFEVLRGVYNE